MIDIIIIGQQHTDFEGYPTGPLSNKVGPFDSVEEAKQWKKDHPEYERTLYGRGYISIESVLMGVQSPDKWKPLVL